MNQGATYTWFAKHEISLSWRDLYAMLSGNKVGRGSRIFFFIALLGIGLHLLAWAVLKQVVGTGITLDFSTLAVISGFLLLPVSLMASQAMESITRAFYTRSDLELILSSPAPAKKLFGVRMSAIALATTSLTLLVSAPAINMLALLDNPAWLSAYPVLLTFGLMATSFAILLTMALFSLIGPSKTRLVAQIVAAVVGANFVIGVQLVAIASIGTISRFKFVQSEFFASQLPHQDSLFWIPAKAATGDVTSLLTLTCVAAILFISTIALTSGKFGQLVIRAASIDMGIGKISKSTINFTKLSAVSVLRRKEWKLLRRDKWLISQTLMQLLYLVPPAFMLWQGFGQGNSPEFVVIPVIVMASGQLAGGLAWLAISGEDAPELVATAPVSSFQIIRAKVEAVFACVAIVVSPLVLMSALLSVQAALIATLTIAASVTCATLIQLWYRSQAKRSNFRRRQTSSRFATIAEAFSSILWAGVAGIWIAGSWYAFVVLPIILAVLLTSWWISPARKPRDE